MTIAQMEVFLKVVETKNFTKAGDELGLTQSAVSHAIASLESTVGFRLITRNRSGISVTSDGEKILVYIRNILKQVELMKQESANILGLQTGTVRIGTFTSVSVQWLPHLLGLFQKEYPHIEIELFEGNYEDVEQWLTDGTIDLGFIPEHQKNTFDVTMLKKDRLVLLLPMKHPYSNDRIFDIQKITSEPFIMPKKGCNVHIKSLFAKKTIQPNIKFEIGDDQAIVAMVQAGLGISILPEMTLPKNLDGIHTSYVGEEVYRSIGIAAISFKKLSPAAKKFLEITEAWFALT